MRLVCPNCSAEYEVDVGAIPDSGRDVQCATCSNTWFQEPISAEEDERRQKEAKKARQRQRKEDKARAAAASDGDATVEASAENEPAPDHGEAPPVDPAVLAILRSEAKHEADARSGDATAAEVDFTPDIPQEGVPEAPADTQPARLTRDRERRLNISMPDETGTPAPKRDNRRPQRSEALPNIDDLNSSLRSASETRKPRPIEDEEDVQRPIRRRRGAYNFGFFLALLIALAGLGAYVLDDQIIKSVPEAEPFLTRYVELVDGLRVYLSAAIRGLVENLANLIASLMQ